MPDKLGSIGLVVAFLALLGWWPMTVARRKNLGLTGIKLWAYVTFVSIVSWIDIFLRSKFVNKVDYVETNMLQGQTTTEKINQETEFLHKLRERQPITTITSSYIKNYDSDWKIWNGVHDTPDQQKRRDRACFECSILEILNEEKGVALVAGSKGGEYITSLTTCNCSDFTRRHKPCKPMYLLASHFGLFDPHSTF